MGIGRYLVGYRPDERGAHYPGAADAGACISCGSPVYLVASGQDAVRGRDAAVVCSYCHERWGDEIQAEL
jgi:hypothetical protein